MGPPSGVLVLIKACPDSQQRAHYYPHHVVEKAVAADADDDLLCLRLPVGEVSFRAGTLLHLQAVDSPHRVLCVGADTAEAGKIVLAHEISRTLPHLLHIQGHVHKGAGALFHGIGRPGIVNVIHVGLGDSVLVSGMPGEGHFLGLYDHNVLRQLLGFERIEAGSAEYGKFFETYIAMELRAYISYRLRPKLNISPLCYWRSLSGFEVDFILMEKIAIETKTTRRHTERDLKGLKALKEEGLFSRYILVCNEDYAQTTESGIEIVPWRQFLDELWTGKVI